MATVYIDHLSRQDLVVLLYRVADRITSYPWVLPTVAPVRPEPSSSRKSDLQPSCPSFTQTIRRDAQPVYQPKKTSSSKFSVLPGCPILKNKTMTPTVGP